MIRSMYIPTKGLSYLLGDKDSKGNHRPAIILRGNLEAVLEALEFAKAKKYKNPFTVTTYRDPTPLKELGGFSFLVKMMDDIDEMNYPRLDKNQFSRLFILHENKDGSTELNLFAVNVANQRQYTTYFDDRDYAANLLFSKMIHSENPKLQNPNKIENSKFLTPNPHWNENQNNLFNEIYLTIIKLSKDKNFVENYSKDLLLDSLKGEGFEIEIDDKSRLFAKDENAKIFLKGKFLNKKFNMSDIVYNKTKSEKKQKTPREYWEISNDKRSQKIQIKYKSIKKESENERTVSRNIGENETQRHRATSFKFKEFNKRCYTNANARTNSSSTIRDYGRTANSDSVAYECDRRTNLTRMEGSNDERTANSASIRYAFMHEDDRSTNLTKMEGSNDGRTANSDSKRYENLYECYSTNNKCSVSENTEVVKKETVENQENEANLFFNNLLMVFKNKLSNLLKPLIEKKSQEKKAREMRKMRQKYNKSQSYDFDR